MIKNKGLIKLLLLFISLKEAFTYNKCTYLWDSTDLINYNICDGKILLKFIYFLYNLIN